MQARPGYKSVKSMFGKLEEIPYDWELASIKSFLKIKMGQSPDSETYNDRNEGLPFFQGVTDFGETYPKPRLYCSNPLKIASADQILFAVRAPVGEVNLSNEECCIGRGIAALEPIDSELEYCFYLLKQFKSRFVAYSQGTTFEAINHDDIGRVKVPFTKSRSEQRRIAAIISNLDLLIENWQSAIERTEYLKRGLMQVLFTWGLGHDAFKDPRFGKSPYQLSKIPQEWDYTILGQNTSLMNGLNKEKDDYGHGCLHVNIDNIFQGFGINPAKLGRVEATQAEIERYKLLKNDICLLRSSVKLEGVGYPALFCGADEPAVFCGFIIRCRPDFHFWDPVFLTYLLQSHFIRRNVKAWATVSANCNINQESLKKLPVPHPPISEQRQIAEILSRTDQLISTLQKQKNNIQDLKKSLMQVLLTGRLRVRV
jgi:type I restriction enzyme S subunit